jgi:hypothetical protein
MALGITTVTSNCDRTVTIFRTLLNQLSLSQP